MYEFFDRSSQNVESIRLSHPKIIIEYLKYDIINYLHN